MTSRPLCGAVLIATLLAAGSVAGWSRQSPRKIAVAHRGASAYAPEHTLAAYRLALDQGADYVEQDLQISRDGVLVCLHDLTLERTTNVEEVFPDRAVMVQGRRMWNVSDFTLEELKRLDAGSWFDTRFHSERIPTFQDAIDLVKGKAGLYPETKGPDVYGRRGLDMEALTLAVLAKNGQDRPSVSGPPSVIIQSFSAESLKRLRRAGTSLPLTFLISNTDPDAARLLSDAGLKEIREFAQGIGPQKSLVGADPTLVRRAHALRLTVTPYTFRSARGMGAKGVREEMAEFLYRLGVDALFTDNPDEFPR